MTGDRDRIHPYSRKAKQLVRSQLRADKVATTRAQHAQGDVERAREKMRELYLSTETLR